MKTPFDAISDLALKSVRRNRERFRDAYDISDKFALWISGFSIAAISLIISNMTNLHAVFSDKELKTIMLLLLVSSVLGIISRYLFGFLYVYDDQMAFALEYRFIKNDMMSADGEELPQNSSIYEIISRLKIDYGEDLHVIIDQYNHKSEQEKEMLRKDLLSHYNKKAQWAQNAYIKSLDFVKESICEVLDLSREKVDEQWNKKLPTKWYRFVHRSIKIIVPLHLTTFLGAILIAVLGAF